MLRGDITACVRVPVKFVYTVLTDCVCVGGWGVGGHLDEGWVIFTGRVYGSPDSSR